MSSRDTAQCRECQAWFWTSFSTAFAHSNRLCNRCAHKRLTGRANKETRHSARAAQLVKEDAA